MADEHFVTRSRITELPMRISMISFGTRGDLEPFLAVEQKLRTAGHDVVLTVPVDLADFARQTGAAIRPFGVDVRDFLGSPESRDMLARGDGRSFIARAMEGKHAHVETLHRDFTAAAEDADLIVATQLAEEEASSLAEWRGVPYIGMDYYPVRSNNRVPHPMLSTRSLGPLGNRLTYRMVDRLTFRNNVADLNKLRHSLGLPPATKPATRRLADIGATAIQAYSKHLVPQLADWGIRRPLVGSLRLDPAQRAALRSDHEDPELERWLADGDAPIYVGFGSIPVGDGRQTLEMIRQVARNLNTRALVVAGWSDYPREADPTGRVYVTSAVDHDSVLPRCRLAVHHGGSGTTAATISAGLPTMICSIFYDQPFWGRRVQQLGVGHTMRLQDADAPSLTRHLQSLMSEDVAVRVKQLAAAMRTEDGVDAAAHYITKAAGTPWPRG
jgi:sterol 3beta-glucosyltransferase